MATIYRALVTSVLLVWGYVVWTGWSAGGWPDALAWHLRVGLVAALLAALVQSLPFAYFLGTGFWIKAFVRASGADQSWEQRHKLWMKGRAYPFMYTPPMLTMAVAIAGSLVETGRIPHAVHPSLVLLAIVSQLACVVLVPREMLRNAALMDELADTHRVPRPQTPEMDALLEQERQHALPPLFQLSRVALLFSVQSVLLWLYLRFGTERFRDVPLLPFVVVGCVLLTVGLALNARHDPDKPAPAPRAWGRAFAVGSLVLVTTVWITNLW